MEDENINSEDTSKDNKSIFDYVKEIKTLTAENATLKSENDLLKKERDQANEKLNNLTIDKPKEKDTLFNKLFGGLKKW